MTEATETPTALNAVTDLVTRLRAAETLVAALKLQIATVKDELRDAMRTAPRKARAPRKALGAGFTVRKPRGPNKPKLAITDASVPA
jgi:hypothetical protein